MVNRGRSGGCITCKQRRVKCDEAKPICRRCQSLGVYCEGYDKKPVRLRFKDENAKFYAATGCRRSVEARGRHADSRHKTTDAPEQAVEVRGKIIQNPDKAAGGLDQSVAAQQSPAEDVDEIEEAQDQAVVLLPPQPTEPDTAVPFFLWHYASIGRDMQSARGFFEMLVPVYLTQPEDSALSLAVSAVASGILALWRRHTDSFRSPRKAYVQAVSRLRCAIQDHTERRKPATVYTILALQLYENLAAVYGLRPAASIHQNGAASLLSSNDMNEANGATHEYSRRFMLYTEIAAALRQKRPLRALAYSWISGKDIVAVPDNPSSKLDAIGACVAELQARHIQLSMRDFSSSLAHGALKELIAEAECLDGQLLLWAQSVPSQWRPRRLERGPDLDSSIPTYRSSCDTYLSCMIADLWNFWRLQRLLLAKITLRVLDSVFGCNRLEHVQDWTGEFENLLKCKDIVQELVDSVCYSVSFYLGNRTRPIHIADLNDPEILVLGYHPWDSEGKSGLPDGMSDPHARNGEHRQHVISQGPWQAMNPLSRLLTLFSEDQGHLIADCLRPGQREWIRTQFFRVTTLLHLPLVEVDNYKEVGGTWNWSNERISDMASSA